jgi:hypothetical protein
VHALTRALPWAGECGLRSAEDESVWGHAGAGRPSSNFACTSFFRPLNRFLQEGFWGAPTVQLPFRFLLSELSNVAR